MTMTLEQIDDIVCRIMNEDEWHSDELDAVGELAKRGLATDEAALRKDAERYRWLRVQRHADIAACWYLPVMPQEYPVDTPEQRDAAIDAAIKECGK